VSESEMKGERGRDRERQTERARDRETKRARLILQCLLLALTLRSSTPQQNGSCRVSLTQIARSNPNNGQKSRFLLPEIWPPGCEKPDVCNVLFASPLASHSPAAKSPPGATVPFLENHQCCRVLCWGLAGMFAGSNSVRFDPAKDSAKSGEDKETQKDKENPRENDN